MSRITVPTWEHQDRLVAFALQQFELWGYAHWQAGCSVGKTLSALKLATNYKRTLVLTVKNAISNAWLADINSKTEGFYVIAPSEGSVEKRQETIMAELLNNTDKQCIVIINYEAAVRMGIQGIRIMSFDFVVADEIHKLKSHDSKQSKELALACERIKHKLGMTGTSWNDRPTDIFGQFRFYTPRLVWSGKKQQLWSGLLGSWYAFFERYVIYRLWEKIKIPVGYKNLDQLGKLIDPHIFYLRTEDARELPPVQHIDIKIPMSAEMKHAYRQMANDMISTFGKQLMVADCALACATRLHQLTSGTWTDTDLKELYDLEGGSPKTEAALEIIENTDEPIVIFTRFKSDVLNLEAALDKAKISHLKVVGGCSEADQWAHDDTRVLIANMSAGSTALNLHKARIGIYYSTGFSASDYEQSLWRIRRPESDLNQNIVYYHLMIDGSVDVEIRSAIESKGATAEKLLKELKNRL